MSGIFKKCKYWWYFIVYLIVWINLIGFWFCEDLTSTECQTEYNLIPINAIDNNYCTTNWYCTNFLSGDINWSSIYINDIQHEWAENINITIPNTIERDYTYTWETLELTIKWQRYDEEKMLNLIDIQNYKPTWEEMSNLISKFADFIPLLWICLLFIAIRYIAKRIFRW